ncbi:DUF3549 family protein [Vibrio viridaestus]|uniref:DUF3549 family protein n=1 Tax=Vibrio viridaestus TaxID=2487322 RepID=A0A3N9TE57_9VIBR|nr:DUF3549 family protein [Vibrio viridaestus]RQW62507.1 DUF3549 family protein [Vibrio viridaestus]
MNKITTLTELLNQSGCQYVIFDLSRRVTQIENSDFSRIEAGHAPYPAPMQRKAHLAIAYWNEQKEPWIWFLKFDLDERGLIKASDIGQFLKYVVEAMGSRLTETLSEDQQEKLANNPYTFKPAEERLAVFHSILRADLNIACSQYYEHAQHYLKGGPGWDNWQTVGLQGMADVCARLNQEHNSVHVKKALRHIPETPKYALLGVLEHIEIPDSLAETIYDLFEKELAKQEIDIFMLAAYLRSLAGAKEQWLNQATSQVLDNQDLCHQEMLIAIAGRSFSALRDPILAQQFLIRLAQTKQQAFFNQLFADLVMQPQLRHVFLTLLHSDATDELRLALTALQQAAKG